MKKKVVTNKKKYHLITDIKNEHRDSAIVSFDDKEELQEFLVEELTKQVNYDFEDDDDVVIYGELLKVTTTEKTYKVNIK